MTTKNGSQQRLLILGAILVAVIAAFAGWSVMSKPAAQAQGAKRTKVVFWNEMTGPAQQQLNTFVKDFNQSQSKYEWCQSLKATTTRPCRRLSTRMAPMPLQRSFSRWTFRPVRFTIRATPRPSEVH